MYADVIIPLAVEGFFTYAVPEEWRAATREGVLVIVPFAGNNYYTGVVRSTREEAPPGVALKSIDRVIDPGFTLSPLQLRFLLWMADYYMACPGEVTRAALPVAARLDSHTRVAPVDAPLDDSLDDDERRLLALLRPGEYLSISHIRKLAGGRDPLPVVQGLLARALLVVKEQVDDPFKPCRERVVRWGRPFSESELHAWLDRLPSQQRAFLCRWIERVDGMEAGDMILADFQRIVGPSPSTLRSLCNKGILEVVTREVSRLQENATLPRPPNTLSGVQQQALDEIRALFLARSTVLLHGVTSSGKTELYIHLIKETIDSGRQVLYLLPEIALTVQIVKRLRCFLGDNVGLYHSGMPDGTRVETWRAQNGPSPYPVILGARSALFLPYRSLGLVIIDEEHETSYKQTAPAPRYHGRDAAIMLASLHGARVLLGSATPSFESYHHALSGKYGLVRLASRHEHVALPRVVLADVTRARRERVMDGIFTPLLRDEMKRVLDAGDQVILFQNRKGYSSYLQCNRCGEIPRCLHCDVSMTYYKSRARLSCNYCGSVRPRPGACEACGEGLLVERVPGTERVEEEVTRLFPSARVARLDLDATRGKEKLQGVINRFEAGTLDVLVGTRMVAKGLDFERVKLVGVIDSDALLAFPDFRVEERAYQLLVQVSGRSGRKGERGLVVMQTARVQHRLHEWLTGGDYHDFYRAFAGEREAFRYPPFCRLIRVELRHAREEVSRRAANALVARLRGELQQRVRGPAVPEVSRIRNEYRVHLLVKTDGIASLPALKRFIRRECRSLLSSPGFKSVKVILDVDPC
ncbi:MAG: primosomal protein N' [Odoribacteraceae bacterium]|jgi:primosomal protein N' (replication factor Y)|nr:primosomal protein N' [Odoribacteraceae bacterium]